MVMVMITRRKKRVPCAGMSLEDLGHEVEYRTDARGHVVPRASTGIGLSSHNLYLIQRFSPVPYLPSPYPLHPLLAKADCAATARHKGRFIGWTTVPLLRRSF